MTTAGIYDVPTLRAVGAQPFGGQPSASFSGAPFVYKPGAPAGGPPNIFGDPASLRAALLPDSVVVVDASITSPAVFPAGDWSNVGQLLGSPASPDASGATQIQFADGADFAGLWRLAGGAAVATFGSSPANAPIQIGPSSARALIVEEGAHLYRAASAAGPAIHYVPGASGNGPALYVGLTALVGGGAGEDIQIDPTPTSTDQLTTYLDGGALAGVNPVDAIGPNAANALSVILITNAQTYDVLGGPITSAAPLLQVIEDRTQAQTPVRFGCQAAASLAPLDEIVGVWSNPGTFPPGDAAAAGVAWVPTARTLRGGLRVTLVGDGSGTLTATFQLEVNGVNVPGAALTLAAGGASVTGSVDGFEYWAAEGDVVTLGLSTNNAPAGVGMALIAADLY